LSQSIRLFKNKRGYVYEGAIHEDVVASIRKAGKGVAFADLPIAHYGYTREEDARKGRRKRNLSMLEAQHQAQPTNPRYWHYLALEHVANDDPGKAIPLLTRLLDEQPHHELAGWSASLLAQGLEMSGERSRAWEAAARASQSHSGRVMGLLRLGELARSEGDPETPRWCAEQLLALDSVRTGVEQRHARALSLRAGGLWENGKRKEAVDEWLAAVRLFPSDGALADQYVRHMDALQGGVRGALEAMRAAPTLVVAAAAVGSFLRAGDPARAVQLARSCPAQTLYTAHTFLRAERIEEALKIFEQQGTEGKACLVLWALERNDISLLERALLGAPDSWVMVAKAVLCGEQSSPALDWLLWRWAVICFDVRNDALGSRLVELTRESEAERGGKLAALMWQLGRRYEASGLAKHYSGSMTAMEVIGLAAFEEGSWDTAGDFLLRRARAGDAPDRVYRLGLQSL
jgi:tetratricopeptide (TPR) repeat protein